MTNDTASAYTYFFECYNDILDYQQNKIPTYMTETLDDIGDSVVKFLKDLENNFACNGICEPGLFWMFRDVKNYPPTNNCQDGIKDVFEEYSTSIAAALIISFIVTAIAFGVNYGLWRRKGK